MEATIEWIFQDPHVSQTVKYILLGLSSTLFVAMFTVLIQVVRNEKRGMVASVVVIRVWAFVILLLNALPLVLAPPDSLLFNNGVKWVILSCCLWVISELAVKYAKNDDFTVSIVLPVLPPARSFYKVLLLILVILVILVVYAVNMSGMVQ